MDPTNPHVLARVRNLRDEVSWRDFAEIYEPLIYRYARLRGLIHEDAREIVQECMALLVQQMPGYEYSPEKGRFKAWLRRITNNKINDMFKRRRPRLGTPEDFENIRNRELPGDDLWEEQWQRKHLRYFLKQILNEVSEKNRQAFELHVVSGWSVEQVSEMLDISADQVYAAKSRITQRLRKKFQDLLGEEPVARRRAKPTAGTRKPSR